MINFPNGPTIGQEYTFGERTWVYNGTGWALKINAVAVEITGSQVTDALGYTPVDEAAIADVATTGSYNDLLDKPSIPAAQVNSDWTATTGVSQILNKPTLGSIANQNANDIAVTGGTLTGVILDDVNSKVGADHIHFKIKAITAITKGDVLRAVGWDAGENALEVDKVSSPSHIAIGVSHDTLAIGAFGAAVNTGTLEGINTSAFTGGAVLYPNTAGGFTATKPLSGKYQALAYVLRSHATQGAILIEASEPKFVAGIADHGTLGSILVSSGTDTAVWSTSKTINGQSILGTGNLLLLETSNTSITAEPGKIPLADAQGMLHPSWAAALRTDTPTNHIGTPGAAGFGVGICPTLPAGITPLSGTTDRLSANYSNYLSTDGSTVVWIPAFYLRRASASNPTFGVYGVDSVDVKALSAFPDKATANASGYYLHRAFVNAGVDQLGFFRDKYDCSLNGNIASSIQGVQPMVSGPAAGQVGFVGATANGQAPTNNYAGAVAAAKSRGAKWFPESIYIADALSTLSEAHAQAATSATHCAWWSAGTTNFPKGNNNSALKDANDLTVEFTSAGNAANPAFALAGSGLPFAKTTHNGQACGVSDVAGNIYKINPGLTCVATTKNITGATQTNPVRLTVTAHGYTTGQAAMVLSTLGMTQIANRIYTITVVDPNTISLDGVDGGAFPAWTSGGTVTTGKFYALKPSVDIATLTGGASLATDLWGAAGIAANYDEVTVNLRTDFPNNTTALRFGNAGNQVFAWGTEAERLQSMLGMPAVGGVSVAGTAMMGNDYFFQYFRDQLCVVSRGNWGNGSFAGSRARNLNNPRTDAGITVGFAASRYL